MQQAGQVPYLDQNDAHKQGLGQSDGSLPAPEQTLNQSINPIQRDTCCSCLAGKQWHTLLNETHLRLAVLWLAP